MCEEKKKKGGERKEKREKEKKGTIKNEASFSLLTLSETRYFRCW